MRAVEQRLADLKFDPGKIDGKFDASTTQAVLSFQKQVGMPRTSKADPATIQRLMVSGYGTPMVADGAPTRVEVDIAKQVLQVWKDGVLIRVLGVSTGSGRHYCDTGINGKRVCGTAVTPVGRFAFDRHIPGKRRSDLGVLYDPVYFKGGFAVHGSPSVPATPASHGCVRIPMWESKWFFDNVAIGTQMIVLKDGSPGVPIVGDALPPPPPAAPTTAPPPAPTTTAAPVAPPVTPAPTTTSPPAPTTTAPPPATTSTTKKLFP